MNIEFILFFKKENRLKKENKIFIINTLDLKNVKKNKSSRKKINRLLKKNISKSLKKENLFYKIPLKKSKHYFNSKTFPSVKKYQFFSMRAASNKDSFFSTFGKNLSREFAFPRGDHEGYQVWQKPKYYTMVQEGQSETTITSKCRVKIPFPAHVDMKPDHNSDVKIIPVRTYKTVEGPNRIPLMIPSVEHQVQATFVPANFELRTIDPKSWEAYYVKMCLHASHINYRGWPKNADKFTMPETSHGISMSAFGKRLNESESRKNEKNVLVIDLKIKPLQRQTQTEKKQNAFAIHYDSAFEQFLETRQYLLKEALQRDENAVQKLKFSDRIDDGTLFCKYEGSLYIMPEIDREVKFNFVPHEEDYTMEERKAMLLTANKKSKKSGNYITKLLTQQNLITNLLLIFSITTVATVISSFEYVTTALPAL